MPRLWIDAHGYAVALLRNGEEPWLRPAELGLFCAEVAKLLRADRLFLPLEPILLDGIEGASGEERAEQLDEAVTAGDLLDTIALGMSSIAGSSMLDRVVPVLPGPSRIVGVNDEDAVETAVLALGDVLRRLSQSRPPRVALQEPVNEALNAASSLCRIAEHAGIDLLLLEGAAPNRMSFPAESRRDAGGTATIVLPSGMVPDCEDLRIVIPPDASPEAVLDALREL